MFPRKKKWKSHLGISDRFETREVSCLNLGRKYYCAFFPISAIYKNFHVSFRGLEITLAHGCPIAEIHHCVCTFARTHTHANTHTYTHTHRYAFGRFTRMPVYPILEPTHGVPRWDTTSNAQCALRDSLWVSGRGFSSPWRQFQGVHPACLRMLKGRSRVARPG